MKMKTSVLLDEAKAIRARAERTRQLAKLATDAEATRAIVAYAENLERRAANLESKAGEEYGANDPGPQQEGGFSRELREEIQQTRATVSYIQHSLAAEAEDGEPQEQEHEPTP